MYPRERLSASEYWAAVGFVLTALLFIAVLVKYFVGSSLT
jgi:hypothetical protein